MMQSNITSGKKNAPIINPLNIPPTPITQFTTPTNPSEINPAIGIKKNIVSNPMISNEIVGVTIISIALGTILCSFSQLYLITIPLRSLL